MNKKYLIIGGIILILALGGYFLAKNINKAKNPCYFAFYYLEGCTHCQQVKDEKSLDKLKELGIDVQEIDVNKDPVKDKIQQSDGNIYTPTFVIGDKMYIGYKSYDELLSLLPAQCKNK